MQAFEDKMGNGVFQIRCALSLLQGLWVSVSDVNYSLKSLFYTQQEASSCRVSDTVAFPSRTPSPMRALARWCLYSPKYCAMKTCKKNPAAIKLPDFISIRN